MRLKVVHQTTYEYNAPVSQSVNQLCLTPRSTDQQVCLSSSMQIDPAPSTIKSTLDIYGNSVSRFSLDQSHKKCTIIVTSAVDTADSLIPLPDTAPVTEIKSLLATDLSSAGLMAHDCMLTSVYVPWLSDIKSLLAQLPATDTPVLEFANALMNFIYTEFEYDSGFSTLVTPITDIISARKGVCQDFAHLAIAILRQCGIPARYVSGYLETLPPPGQQKLQGSDATHAWFSVYVPKQGWFDFDPTNNKRPDAQYVTTAWGRDYADVAPLRGVVFGGGQTILKVAVDVNRVEKGLSAVATD